ncbi:hypothetical protein CCMSSC00406_0007082 [Pleurotus cornucopiae]|uniref:Uncharacterized protein n=1 Tax=Pleurotus cornucopiae TaxID=5321 RepID=A0ACB7J572_PLECO|nr:hypothetical protein CCMSSC00406_0007082 [Pleurotus cornucopiae]
MAMWSKYIYSALPPSSRSAPTTTYTLRQTRNCRNINIKYNNCKLQEQRLVYFTSFVRRYLCDLLQPQPPTRALRMSFPIPEYDSPLRALTRSEYFASLEPLLSISPRPIRHAPAQKRLPVELIYEVLSYITDPDDLRSVARASKQLHSIVLPRLWTPVSLSPVVRGQVLSDLEGQLDEWCTARKTRGEQTETLDVSLKNPGWSEDVRDAYIPVQRILRQLPNLTSLALNLVGPFDTTPRWPLGLIDTSTQSPCLKTVVFSPPTIKTRRGAITHPESQFEAWLFAQESIEHLEYRTRHPVAQRFPPNAVPNLRRLQISLDNIRMVAGMQGPRGITHLKVTMWCGDTDVPRLPPALSNVTVLARDARDLRLAGLLPKLERLDVEYEWCSLASLLADLRRNGTSRKGNFPRLRRLRACGLCVARGEEEGGMVGRVFKELEGLESLEVMRDDLTCVRYGRDGATRVVRWTCEESEVWYHDWEEDVVLEDPGSALVFFREPTTALAAAAAALGESPAETPL